MTSNRVSSLQALLRQCQASNGLVRIIETHSGITGLIAEHVTGEQGETFDGMWSSSLTASSVRGMPDIEAVDTSSRLDIVRQTMFVTHKPMIYDADTGGHPEIFKFTVRALESLGVSAAIIEDKEGLKRNSLLDDEDSKGATVHQLCQIDDFCDRIRAGIAARSNKDFMIIARMEALISKRPMKEVLDRATASVQAGASGIMIHSREKSPKEVIEFMSKFRSLYPETPIVVVPSSYNRITEKELVQAGASICIYANHLFRSAYPAMVETAKSILNHSRSYEASRDLCMSVKEITNLVDFVAHPSKVKEAMIAERGVSSLTRTRNTPLQKTVAVGARHSHSLAADGTNDVQVDPSGLLDFMDTELGIKFFTGVPDSCINTFCAEIDRRQEQSSSAGKNATEAPVHAIAANEGCAVALAIGNYLATGKVPLVYMQNSGLGNAVNPLLSAAHAEVYGVPMVLMLGWRGRPGAHDEPQHMVTGRQTKEILASLDIETFVLSKSGGIAQAKETLRAAHKSAKAGNRPVAVLVEPKTFSGKVVRNPQPTAKLSREAAILHLFDVIGPNDAVVSTTGFTSRELYELRESKGDSHSSDFLCVGSMGHALSIAQGIALAQPKRTVWCIDGDGAALMHAGSMASTASLGLSNLRHVLINNEAHESVGGQATAASQQKCPHHNASAGFKNDGNKKPLSFADLASNLGYECIGQVNSSEELMRMLPKLGPKGRARLAPAFLEVKVACGARDNLGRPKNSTHQTKTEFMHFLEKPLPPCGDDDVEKKPQLSVPSLPLMQCDSLLLTPGPLTTSTTVKLAMMHDFGSRDKSFVELTARVRKQIVNVIHGDTTDLTSVLLQGSGTFAVEAMMVQFVPRSGGKVLILSNGAYGRRMAMICKANGRLYEIVESAESMPLNLDEVKRAVDGNSDASHVAIVSCETTTGVLNPVSSIADLVASSGKRLLIDCMSSFGVIGIDASMPFDAIAASSNKGLQGSPGLAFVVARKNVLTESEGNAETLVLDLYDQWIGFEKSGEWRFTPPTHCMLALSQALDEFEAEGGTEGRRVRYEANCKVLVDGMRDLGFQTILSDEVQAPVIVTFRLPLTPKFDFKVFYDCLVMKGYTIYPGKLTAEPSFRVGCIGHLTVGDMRRFLSAASNTLKEMGVYLHEHNVLKFGDRICEEGDSKEKINDVDSDHEEKTDKF